MHLFKKYAFAISTLLIFSCGEEAFMDLDSQEHIFTVDSPVSRLLSRTTMNNGTVDNLLDQSDCFTLELPVVVKIGDEEYEIRTEADYDFLSELLSPDLNKVFVCHKTGSGMQTISINESALQAHLNHGDTLGTCEGQYDDEEEEDDHDNEDGDDDDEDEDDDENEEDDEDDDDDDEDDDEDDDDDDKDDEDDDDDDEDDEDDDDDDDDDEDDDDNDDDDDDDEDDSVTLCHKTGNGFITIEVSASAVQAHLGHGDVLGACDDQGDKGYAADRVKLVFPVTIIKKDYSRMVINSQEELDALRAACEGEGGSETPIDCVDLKYPVNVSIFDAQGEFVDRITFESDEDFYLFIGALNESDGVGIVFPITLVLADGQEVIVNSLSMLEALIDANASGCADAS